MRGLLPCESCGVSLMLSTLLRRKKLKPRLLEWGQKRKNSRSRRTAVPSYFNALLDPMVTKIGIYWIAEGRAADRGEGKGAVL